MSSRTWFLLGVLGGVILTGMVTRSQLIKARTQARIEAVVVSDTIYKGVKENRFIMHNIPTRYGKKAKLQIIITTPDKISEAYRKKFPRSKEDVLGFYDVIEHTVWTPDSTSILIHELRHVFEGAYHQ